MRILTGILIGMLMGGGAVWASHDEYRDNIPNSLSRFDRPFGLSREDNRRMDLIYENNPLYNPCRR
jgi:hypothetical protein